jgi:mannose-6-phosphate isomerase-like protein (cupin superfamily)
MKIITGAGVYAAAAGQPPAWAEQFRVPDLSVGTYSIPAGGTDEQTPHTEDELYVITAGRATFEGGGEHVQVAPGSVIYVPAGETHRFRDITADLAALVIFGPAEYSRDTAV